MKLSEEMKDRITYDEPISDEQIEDWADDAAKLEAENEALGELLSPLVDVELERDKLKAENEAWFELCRSFVGGGDKHILKLRNAYLLTEEKPETPISDVPITP